jgi:hypothetical protein
MAQLLACLVVINSAPPEKAPTSPFTPLFAMTLLSVFKSQVIPYNGRESGGLAMQSLI